MDSSGAEANAVSQFAAFSRNGRYVAFQSDASNLVPNDTNNARDIFVRDLVNNTTVRVSVDSTGIEGNGESDDPCISADGRFVAYHSLATNLVPNDTNGQFDIFVYDMQTGITERVDVDSSGAQGLLNGRYPAISDDGRYVAFASNSSNLVPNDTNNTFDVFVHDRQTGATDRMSVDSGGNEGNFQSLYCTISGDGRYVAFESIATNLDPNDTNGVRDIFLRDTLNLTTTRISVDSSGVQANAACFWPQFAADGGYVTYYSAASNLVAGDTNGVNDVFVYNLQTGATERVSVDSTGAQAGGQSLNSTISANGRYVTFESVATNLVPGDVNAYRDIFLRDRLNGTTELLSINTGGAQTDGPSASPAISGDGRFTAFQSGATNLVAGDTNNFTDIFVRDRGAGPPGQDLCQAGTGSVMACPCGNPPANAPRGCDNSAGTGGAQITSTGTASLSNDTVVFVTNGEKPTATSIVLQGTVEVTNGLAFGQGVRCVGGSLKRLYTKTASGGSITAPGSGDPSVSLRSAILNQPIPPGANRWYAVYYRDPAVLGGCPATSTFNITQTQIVAWAP